MAVSALAEGLASFGEIVEMEMGVVVVISLRLGDIISSRIVVNISAGRFFEMFKDDNCAGLPTTSFPQFSATSSSSSRFSNTIKVSDDAATSAMILSGVCGDGKRLMLPRDSRGIDV